MCEKFYEVIYALEDLREDSGVSKNIKIKINNFLKLIESKDGTSIITNKLLTELDELSNDSNMPAHIRTQIWHIASLLETV